MRTCERCGSDTAECGYAPCGAIRPEAHEVALTVAIAQHVNQDMVKRAKQGAQDRGAKLGMLRTQIDAYNLGECGIAAIQAAFNV